MSVTIPIITVPITTTTKQEDTEWKTIRITSKIKERQKRKEPIANHKWWQILMETKDEEADPDELATTINQTMQKIAEELKLRPTKKDTLRQTKLPQVLCRAIIQQRNIWKKYTGEFIPSEIPSN